MAAPSRRQTAARHFSSRQRLFATRESHCNGPSHDSGLPARGQDRKSCRKATDRHPMCQLRIPPTLRVARRDLGFEMPACCACRPWPGWFPLPSSGAKMVHSNRARHTTPDSCCLATQSMPARAAVTSDAAREDTNPHNHCHVPAISRLQQKVVSYLPVPI